MTAARIRSVVEGIGQVAKTLDMDLADVDGLQYAFLADMLHQLREGRASLQRSEAAIEAEIARLFREFRVPGDKTEVPGVGVVHVKRGKDRKAWDHQGLAKLVVEQLIERRGGEIPTAWDVRDALMQVAAIAYWRVTELRRHGIEPDDYCEAIPGRPSVIITGGST